MGSVQHDHLTPASSPRPWTHCPRRASRAQLQQHDAPSRLWTLVHRRLVDLSSALFPAPLRTVNGLPHPKSIPNTSSHGELPVARAPAEDRPVMNMNSGWRAHRSIDSLMLASSNEASARFSAEFVRWRLCHVRLTYTSATSVFFSQNKPTTTTNQQYFSLRTNNQHQPPAKQTRCLRKKLWSTMQILYHGVYLIFLSDLLLPFY
jgi:hypothetical protein